MRSYAAGSVAPSVHSTSACLPRGSTAPDATTARRPANDAAPVSPATTPTPASSRIASSAASSLIAVNTSTPDATVGHAISETVPQFRPAMIESCGPGTNAGAPASAERRPHAADNGSTATIVAVAAQCATTAAVSAPTPIGTTTRSGRDAAP